MGTPVYMAPEQARGESGHIDGRTDLWAVGAVLHRVLTGRFVHEADTSEMTIVLAATQAARPLRDVLPDAPSALAEVVDRALATRVDDRFGCAAAMLAALERIAADGVSAATSPTTLASATAVSQPTQARPSPSSVRTVAKSPSDDLLRVGLAKTADALAPSTLRAWTPEPRPRSSGARARRGALAAVTVFGALAAALALSWRASAPPLAGSAALSNTPPISPSPAPSVAVVSATTGAPAAAAKAPSSEGGEASASTPPSAHPIVQVPANPAATSRSVTQGAGSASPPASATGAKATQTCDPPYYFDAEGNKRRKLDCYR